MRILSKDNALSFLLFPCHFGCFLGFFSGWVVWLGFFLSSGLIVMCFSAFICF